MRNSYWQFPIDPNLILLLLACDTSGRESIQKSYVDVEEISWITCKSHHLSPQEENMYNIWPSSFLERAFSSPQCETIECQGAVPDKVSAQETPDFYDEQLINLPWLPQPVPEGQKAALSPERHAPFQRAPPSEPDHWLQDTSVNEPVRAPCPEGKNTFDAPESSQRSKLLGKECRVYM